jgi:hypothetical protein
MSHSTCQRLLAEPAHAFDRADHDPPGRVVINPSSFSI